MNTRQWTRMKLLPQLCLLPAVIFSPFYPFLVTALKSSMSKEMMICLPMCYMANEYTKACFMMLSCDDKTLHHSCVTWLISDVPFYRTLSTPNEESWPGVSQLPDYKTTFPSWHKNVLPESVKNLDETGLDLVQVLFRGSLISAVEFVSFNTTGELIWSTHN